jgi:hypothetical protein
MAVILQLPSRDQIAALDTGERMRLAQELARADRQLFAASVDLLDVMDAEGDHVTDGHRSVVNLVVALTNDDPTVVRGKLRAMKALRVLPDVRERLADGEFGVGQVMSVAGAYGNPRVRDDLQAIEEQLIDWAECPFDEFDGRVHDFVRLADAEGIEQRDTARHERRNFHLSPVGNGFAGSFGCGNAQGVTIQAILEHFTNNEFEADWAEAKARVGAGVTKNDLQRTSEQRKMDALHAMCLAAAAATPGLQPPAPLVNLVMDVRTFDETVEYAATGVWPTPDLSDITSRRCHTTDGVPIPRMDALAAMLQGHVRRVVVDRGVTIDLGRRKRLFTGNARDAVMLRSIRCVWAGCDMPASRCQADHLEPWTDDGETNAKDGAPACGRHNRWKTKGFTITTDDRGHWHTHRPDGTNINSPPAT